MLYAGQIIENRRWIGTGLYRDLRWEKVQVWYRLVSCESSEIIYERFFEMIRYFSSGLDKSNICSDYIKVFKI